MSRPYHHGDLRKALITEAAKVIETEGVGALTLRELSRRLGVSHAAPTNHFDDKDALLAEIVGQGFAELAHDLASVASDEPPQLRLQELGRAYVRFALRRPGHFRVMFGRGFSKDVSSRPAQAGGRAYTLLEQAVIAALPPPRVRSAGRVREATFLAWSVVHGAAMLVLDGPLVPRVLASSDDERTVTALVDHATALVAAAISAGAAPKRPPAVKRSIGRTSVSRR